MTTEISSISAESVAYPTIGVILLGGISDRTWRNPLHTSAGFAYTGLDYDIDVHTKIYAVRGQQSGSINGEPVKFSQSSRSPFYVLNKYAPLIFRRFGVTDDEAALSFSSTNRKVLSGSSDAGAAAIGAGIQSLSGGTIPLGDLEPDLRAISESAARSLYGGLSVTWASGREIRTERILGPEEFDDYVIVGCRFNVPRNPSDRIHENIVHSPDYNRRVESTRNKGSLLVKLAEDRNIEGIFELAHHDTDEYHALIESVGVHVITERMRSLMEWVNSMRREYWLTYIVTGGSNVFVIVRRKDLNHILPLISGKCDEIDLLKVSCGAHTI
ncbi:MAG: diphosphomevalonate decarboxylase [Thermoplasmataceae archaeon]